MVRGDIVTVACFVKDNAEIYEELKNIEIYSIENKDTVNVADAKSDKPEDVIPATVTLIVTDAQAKKLIYAEYSGKIHIIFEKRGN